MALRMSARVAVVAALFVLPGCHKPASEEAAPAPVAVKVQYAARAETLKDITFGTRHRGCLLQPG